MIKRHTQLLGVSAILVGLWAPFTVQAHENDNTWLYVAGAVATYGYLNDHGYHHRDRHYARKYSRRQARRHHRRAHRHDRHMHRAHDRYRVRHQRHDRHARRHDDRNDHRDGRRSDRRRS